MRVLITGGAGYLGRGMLRRALYPPPGGKDLGWPDLGNWQITVYSRDETKQDECRQRYPGANYVLGDVRDTERLTAAMQGQQLVIHAAAMKYIPDAELNAGECVGVNIDGTQSVIAAAKAAGVSRVVGISTDKACGPVNVYGATKMIMERLFADEARLTAMAEARVASAYRPLGPVFSCVRYGNVIGSTGSVLPMFARQYAETGKVKITDPHMTRFWMGVDEAIDLVVAAAHYAQPGSVLVPFARAMKLIDAARAATTDDVEVEIIGTRPGEKAHELLIHHEESVRVVPLQTDGKAQCWELLRPGSPHNGEAAMTLSSAQPNRLMSVIEMRGLINDAAEV